MDRMKPAAFEGVVEGGLIRLASQAKIPDRTRVIVVVPEPGDTPIAHIASPTLVNPADLKELEKVVGDD